MNPKESEIHGEEEGKIENLDFDQIETALGFESKPELPPFIDINGNLTKRNDQPSREKSTESVNQTLEYFNDSDYSRNIASAVATIVAEDVGDIDYHKETVRPSESKRTWMYKKSKQKIRRSKSSTEKYLSDPFKPSTSKSNINRAHAQESLRLMTSFGSADNDASQPISISHKTVHSGSVLSRATPPSPLPKNPNMVDVNVYLAKIQEYINRLGYHRQGEPKIRVQTHMSMKHQTDTARLLIRAGVPIKCLHALVLAIHFSNCTTLIERFTINFKSNFNGKEYKHVVLGVYMYGFYGSLGISRDATLQDKPVAFPRLSDLITEYKSSYEESGHILIEVRIGGVVTHDPHSLQNINWKLGSIGSKSEPIKDASDADKIAKSLRMQMGSTCLRQLRLEISPPLSIPINGSGSPIITPDLPAKPKASASLRSTTVNKTISRTRALANNLPFKKKPKN